MTTKDDLLDKYREKLKELIELQDKYITYKEQFEECEKDFLDLERAGYALYDAEWVIMKALMMEKEKQEKDG